MGNVNVLDKSFNLAVNFVADLDDELAFEVQVIKVETYERLASHPGVIEHHGRMSDSDSIILSCVYWYGLDQFLIELMPPSVHNALHVVYTGD